jgi:hypothetical protein
MEEGTFGSGPSFDLIMFHRSFEHVSFPAAALREAASFLSDNGRILIRLPLASSYAFDRQRAIRERNSTSFATLLPREAGRFDV